MIKVEDLKSQSPSHRRASIQSSGYRVGFLICLRLEGVEFVVVLFVCVCVQTQILIGSSLGILGYYLLTL